MKKAKKDVINNFKTNELKAKKFLPSVKTEEIIKKKSKKVNNVISKIDDLEKRKELIKAAKEILKDMKKEDPMEGGLLF